MNVCVFGAGAVGGHLATRLAATGTDQVSVIARGPVLQAIREQGLTLHSGGEEIRARPDAATDDPAAAGSGAGHLESARRAGRRSRDREPKIPTLAEAGVPGYEAFTWGGLVAPAGAPANVVQRLNKEIVEIFREKEMADQLLNQGAVPLTSSPQELDAYIRDELKKWGEIVKTAKIKLE